MSTSPWNPVFREAQATSDPPRSSALVHPITNGMPQGPTPSRAADDAYTHAEISSIAQAIEELQNRLERANRQLGLATTARTSEVEIGRLLMEAQRFSEVSISRLEQQIQQILLEAESKATQILREATQEAHEIRRQAQESVLVSTRTAQELQSAIAGFTVVNSALVSELTALNAMLTPAAEQKIKAF